jgi:ribosomal protein S18 acetylase RimI-like enzyme
MLAADCARFPSVTTVLKNGASATVRPLAEEDADALGDFYEAIPREDCRFYCPYPLTREQDKKNAARASSPTEVVLVVEVAGTIGGYAWYRWKEGAAASTFGICVRRSLQGTGAGKALMNRLLEIAREVGPPVMNLTVQKANPHAVELYQKMDFVIVREQMRGAAPEFPSEPEYLMQLRVR